MLANEAFASVDDDIEVDGSVRAPLAGSLLLL